MKSAPEIMPVEDDPFFQKVSSSVVRDLYRPSSPTNHQQLNQQDHSEQESISSPVKEYQISNNSNIYRDDEVVLTPKIEEIEDRQTRAQDIILQVIENEAMRNHKTVTVESFSQPISQDVQNFVMTPTPQNNSSNNPQQVAQQNTTRLDSPHEVEIPTIGKKLSKRKSSKNLSLFDVIIGGNKSKNNTNNQFGNNEPAESEKHKRKRTICGWQIPLRWYQILTAIGWIVMIGVSLWYSINSIVNFVDAINNPTTSLSYVEEVPLPFPAISICNWNALTNNCSYCGLRLEKVFRADIQKDIPEYLQQAEYKEIRQDDSLFRCYVFNNRSINVVTANYTGYTGSLSFFVRVPRPTGSDVSDYSRVGLQVSFHSNGTMPDLVGETNFAVPRRDNYFMLTKIITSRLKTTPINPQLVDVRWEPVTSDVELIGADETLVVISVAYATLNVNYITEVVTSSIESLFGEIAGFLGLTMGLDMLKILRGILDVPYSIKDRTLMNLWNTFN
ncbi:predicted protein [Naegleria gruberi]|uniref:Predicted protein n=1 Tax=Naegleria gruberi TaxID=5762 RepID=D2V6F8_NAEGR|nr:uncharacterized protein NAEGRDRAFT_64420 [Naegleria gruberi]EFC47565.1 predicted protein [Naegleria gruberi]|eukprot:XP_002680309.1 predicted protein [Naegleria gruberi strain NEG-M]